MAVYQDFGDHIVAPFTIPPHFERLGGADFGIRDETVLLMGAIDPKDGTVYIYDEYYKNGLAVPQHAKSMREMVEKVPYGKLRALVGDPSGKRKGITDMRSIFDHYAEYGLWFKDGDNRIDTGIAKVQAYFSLGRLKIFSSCANLIREGLNYKYKPEELSSKTNPDNKPIDKDNHACFIAGTLIETNKGLVPIEKVKIGDKVWTRQGYKRVYDSSLTGVNKKVYKAVFSNGSSVVATGNHPIFVDNKGFSAIDSLRYSDIIKVSEHWEELKCTNQMSILSSGTENNGEDTLIQNILVTEGTLKRRTNGFIGKYGNSIMEKSQKDTMFTTKTMIPQTITLIILKLLKLRNILSTTQKNKISTLITLKSVKNGLRKHKRKHLIGISLTKVKSGTDSTLSTPLLNSLKKLKKKLAKTVTANLKPLTLKLSFAPTNASQHGDENKDMTMYKGSVLYAEQSLQSTSTAQQKRVQESVQVLAVTELKTVHDVYNISVEDAHEYYANGVLVKNCDSLRYLVQELPDDPANLIQKSYQSRDFAGKTEDGHLPFALQTDDMPKGNNTAWLYY